MLLDQISSGPEGTLWSIEVVDVVPDAVFCRRWICGAVFVHFLLCCECHVRNSRIRRAFYCCASILGESYFCALYRFRSNTLSSQHSSMSPLLAVFYATTSRSFNHQLFADDPSVKRQAFLRVYPSSRSRMSGVTGADVSTRRCTIINRSPNTTTAVRLRRFVDWTRLPISSQYSGPGPISYLYSLA